MLPAQRLNRTPKNTSITQRKHTVKQSGGNNGENVTEQLDQLHYQLGSIRKSRMNCHKLPRQRIKPPASHNAIITRFPMNRNNTTTKMGNRSSNASLVPKLRCDCLNERVSVCRCIETRRTAAVSPRHDNARRSAAAAADTTLLLLSLLLSLLLLLSFVAPNGGEPSGFSSRPANRRTFKHREIERTHEPYISKYLKDKRNITRDTHKNEKHSDSIPASCISLGCVLRIMNTCKVRK